MAAAGRQSGGFIQAGWLMIIGASIGWLTGLSASPVIAGVLATFLGIVAGLITGLQAIKRSDAREATQAEGWIDARPAALVMIGLALAAPVGVMVRSHNLLAPRNSGSASPTGQSQSRAFDAGSGVLFGVHTQECEHLLARAQNNPDALRTIMQISESPWARRLAEKLTDPSALKNAVEAICARE